MRIQERCMNLDKAEIQKFDEVAHHWWDPHSFFKPLHDINPLRLGWLHALAHLPNKQVLDVGCGGGILSESMAMKGATVTGIDLSPKALEVAQLHALESGVSVRYMQKTVEACAQEDGPIYDIVTCMEMLEHVPDFSSVVKACSELVKPGGWVFFSTINRHIKAYLQAILAAEYCLKWLPKGTHDYAQFITPAELAHSVREAGLTLCQFKGISYRLLTQTYALTDSVQVNYLLACRK